MPISSHDINIGGPCPTFSLPSVDGHQYSLESFNKSKGLLIAFICNHCPYVQAIEDRLLAIAHQYPREKLQVVGICSNDWAEYPEDAPDKLLMRWTQKKYGFPYLIDESQDTARAFDAVCTPDLFLFDVNRHLFYHGRIDDNWKNANQATTHELKDAIDGLLAGQKPPQGQHPTVGCSIKWKH